MRKFSYKNPHCLLEFTPDKVDGKKVYNVHINGQHSIYMTEEFVKALMDDNGEEKNIDRIQTNDEIFLANNENSDFKGNILNQKIILDMPKENKEPLNFNDFHLGPTRYGEKLEETLTIRPIENFLLFSKGNGLIFKFAGNDIEAKNFSIRDMNARGKTIIDIDCEDGVCKDVSINALKNTFNGPDIYFSFKGFRDEDKKPSSIYIRNFGVSTTIKGEEYCYSKFSASSLYVIDGSIGSKSNDLGKDFLIEAKKNIFMLDANLTLEPDENNIENSEFGIKANKIEFQKIDAGIRGSFVVSKDIEIGSEKEKSYFSIQNTKIDGGFVYANINKMRAFVRLIDVNANVGKSYLQCQGSIELENVVIQNNDKVSLKNVNLYCAEIKKVFQLIGVNAYYTKFDNVFLENTRADSLISLEIGEKNKEIDSSFLNNFKNVNIYIKNNETFIAKGNNPLSFTSCDFEGDTFIETKNSNPNSSYKISAVNSKFIDSSLSFSSNGSSETIINNSEIKGELVCDSVNEITTSCIQNVKLNSLDKVESCYLQDYNHKSDEKETSLISVNSDDRKILPNDTQMELL
jgi:hypothetical protein